ncbi:hypothetical protein Rhopal_002931-T1 [Rhodotorula paludigena]|uniref:Uncharacterized protein n=1 Tax=Rhodotorula paludigena TaxID=86838 RepID=A0AAV5GKF3_9BASI|nr:hypothetical protein Rhopal_002931-T1 [Rhodotorula paludigena]
MARKFLTARKSDLIRKRQEEEARLAALGEDGGDKDLHDPAHQNRSLVIKLNPNKNTAVEVISLVDSDTESETSSSGKDEEDEVKPYIARPQYISSRGTGPASQAPSTARVRPAPSPSPAPKRARRSLSRERGIDNNEQPCPTCGRSDGRDAEAARKLNEFGEFLRDLGGTLDKILALPVAAPGDAGEQGKEGKEGEIGGGAGEWEGA